LEVQDGTHDEGMWMHVKSLPSVVISAEMLYSLSRVTRQFIFKVDTSLLHDFGSSNVD